MKKSQLKQIIMEEIQNIFDGILVRPAGFAIRQIWMAYLEYLKESFDPELSPDFDEAYAYINSAEVSSIDPYTMDELVSAIVKTNYESSEILGEREGAYYSEDTRPSIIDICEKLNFAQTEELISKLDIEYNYDETL